MALASRPHSTAAARRVGIVAALPVEARALGPARARPDGLSTLVDDTLVAAGADALVSFGLAGGLDPALAPGAILVPREVIADDGAALPTDAAWCAQVAQALAPHRPILYGRLLTSPRALGSVSEKADAFRRTGASAVDMESSGVARVAEAHRLPFVVLRVIVDGASDVLPPALALIADSGGPLRWGRLIGHLALAPHDVLALVRLAGRYGTARRALRAAAGSGALSAPPRTP